MPFCTKCGKQNPATARFCTSCGAPLEKPATPVEFTPVHTPVPLMPETESSFQEKGKAKPLSTKSKVIMSVIIVLAAAFAVIYYLFIKADPYNDGNKIAAEYCECTKIRQEEVKEAYRKYIKDFDSYHFSGKGDAQKKLDGLFNLVSKEAQDRYEKNTLLFQKLREKYGVDIAQIAKFELGYNDRLGLCNGENSEMKSLYNNAVRKINIFNAMAEKNKAMQDSKATIESELQLATAEVKTDQSANELGNSSIQRIACSDNHNYFSSLTGNKTTIKFINKTGNGVKLYWIDSKGEQKFYINIPGNGNYLQPTYAGHVWLVTDLNENCFVRFKAIDINYAEAIIK